MSAACQHEAFREYQLLGTKQLEELCARAANRDVRSTFSKADFDILRNCGYPIQAVPEELGGLGFPMSQVGCQQRRLAYWAPAAALALHSHLYWTGLAADLGQAGDPSLEWLLREAADGEVIAATHVDADDASDPSVVYRDLHAHPVDGGYCFTGHTGLGSPVAAWTRLAVRGIDCSDATAPRIVHAFIARDSDGLGIRQGPEETGTRATQFGDITFDAVFVPDRYIARVVPQGSAIANRFVLCSLMWAALGIGNVSCGIAQAAFQRAIATIAAPLRSAPRSVVTLQAELQEAVSEMAMSLQAIEALLDRITADWCTGIDHADAWPARILGTACRTAELAVAVVVTAAELADGDNDPILADWKQLVSDASHWVVHPADVVPARKIIARSHLGRELDESPCRGPQST